MKDTEFIKRVQEQIQAETMQEAAEITRAALGTLGELLSPTERRKLTAQLPGKLKEYANAWDHTLDAALSLPHFPLEKFYTRVAARANLRYPETVRRTMAVMRVLTEQVSEGQINDVLDELSPEFEELFTGQPVGPVSPSRVKGGLG